MSVAAAAGIAAAGSLIAQGVSNSGNKKSQARADAYNLAQWHRQNDYNDPQNQMSRLKNAGLNPNLIYGSNASGAAGNADGVPPSKAAPYEFKSPIADVQATYGIKNTEAQTDNLKVQNTVLEQERQLKQAQTLKTLSEGRLSKTQELYADDLISTTLEGQKEINRKREQETIGAELDNAFKDGALKDQLKRIYYEAANARATYNGQILKNKLTKYEADLVKLGISPNSPWWVKLLGDGSDKIDALGKAIDDYGKNKVQPWLKSKFKN
jgi:hypothetical protein